MAQSRSTMSWSSGAWSRSTTFAPDAASAILSDVKYCRNASPAMITQHEADADVEDAQEHDEEGDVERAQQEERRHHAQ